MIENIKEFIESLPKADKCYQVSKDFNNYDPYESTTELVYTETPNKAKSLYLKKYGCYYDVKYIDLKVRRNIWDDGYYFEGEDKKYTDIERILIGRNYKERVKILLLENPNSKCYIYSGEHGCFWRANSAGYSHNSEGAGIYNIKEAAEILLGVSYEKRLSIEIVDEAKLYKQVESFLKSKNLSI